MSKRPPVVHYRLSRSSPAIKVLTTGSLLLILAGILVVIYFAMAQSGLTPEGLAQHYQGSEEEKAGQLYFAIGKEELLRITHVHTFGMGMLLYIFGHMFTLTGARERTKVLLIGAMFVGLAGFLGSLWLIAYVSTAFVWLFLGSFFLALASLGTMSLWVLAEIWFIHPRRAEAPSVPAADGVEKGEGG
ncbi:MAG: hypothetical protein AB1405_07975 [Bdellovibrionota bacterium]